MSARKRKTPRSEQTLQLAVILSAGEGEKRTRLSLGGKPLASWHHSTKCEGREPQRERGASLPTTFKLRAQLDLKNHDTEQDVKTSQ